MSKTTDRKILAELVKLRKRIVELEKLVITDSLTQVYNRRGILDLLDTELSRIKRYGKKFSLIMIDIDKFKAVNDINFILGNFVLREIASIMKDRVRSHDFVGRIGGDEFLIILPETSSKNAMRVANAIREEVAKFPFELNHDRKAKKITISGGFMEINPETHRTSTDCLEALDSALKKSKKKGRNQMTKSGE